MLAALIFGSITLILWMGSRAVLSGAMSGGELARVQLAKLNYHKANLLILDEPTAGPETAAETIAAVEFRRQAAPEPPAAKRRRTGWNVLVYGLLGMLALLAWFVFTATPVRLEADPPEALRERIEVMRGRVSAE